MDKGSFHLMNSSHIRELLVMIIVLAVVCGGIFFTFAQFSKDSLQGVLKVHTADAGITYYEWDNAGIRHERQALFSEFGFIEGLIGSDYMDAIQELLAAETAEAKPGDVTRHRLGYSFVLDMHVDLARMVLINVADIPYIVFLDDSVLYTDFPGEQASLDALPMGISCITDNYDSGAIRETSISLPMHYFGKTLTIIEYLTPEQAAYWSPMSPDITSFENTRLEAIMSYGANGILGGMVASVLISMTILIVVQLFGGGRPYLLLLPLLFALMYMIEVSSYVNMASSSFLVHLQDLIVSFSIYCAGNLLLVFLACKMKHPSRYVLLFLATGCFVITVGLLLSKFTRGEFLSLEMDWLGALGTAAFMYAIVLMVLESKSNHFFKHCGWWLMLGGVLYSVALLVFYHTDMVMFAELYGPMSAIVPDMNFYPLNGLLSALIMIVITILSITDYISALMEQRVRLASLEQINRLKTEFLGNVSHEMRTPLTVASVNVQIVSGILSHMSDAGLDSKASDLLASAQSEIMRLSRMVGGLLTLASISESTEKRKVDVSALLQSAANVLGMILAKKGNELGTEISDGLISFGDADMLSQVIVNLVQNAHTHTKSDVIRLCASQCGSKITIAISDKGSGIAPNHLPHVFERGFSGNEGEGGTGFGLFLCKSVVESHGGEIWIESILNEGTTVHFTLPVYEGQYGEGAI